MRARVGVKVRGGGWSWGWGWGLGRCRGSVRFRGRVSRAAPPPASFARHSEADAEGAAP